MAYETLIVEIEDYTCLIRLNRPDAMNALNIKMMSELADAVGAADRNDKGARSARAPLCPKGDDTGQARPVGRG